MRGVETCFEEDLTSADREYIARLKERRKKSFERIGPEVEEPEEEILNPSKDLPEDW